MECTICLRSGQCVEEAVVTRCGHVFCWPCLYRWAWLPEKWSPNDSNDPCPRCGYVHAIIPKQRLSCPVCKACLPDHNTSVTPIYMSSSSSPSPSPSPSTSPSTSPPTSPSPSTSPSSSLSSSPSSSPDSAAIQRHFGVFHIPPRPKPRPLSAPNPNPSVPCSPVDLSQIPINIHQYTVVLDRGSIRRDPVIVTSVLDLLAHDIDPSAFFLEHLLHQMAGGET